MKPLSIILFVIILAGCETATAVPQNPADAGWSAAGTQTAVYAEQAQTAVACDATVNAGYQLATGTADYSMIFEK